MSWLNRIRGRSYQPVPTSNQLLPGAFPEDDLEANHEITEQETPQQLNLLGDLISQWLTTLIVKPIMFFVVISLHIILTAIKLVYSNNPLFSVPPPDGHPIDKVSKFILKLEDNLMPDQVPTGLPPFFQGSYTQALYMATHRAKFLFVYLANPSNEGNSILFRKVITNPEFIALCQQDQILIWGGDLTNLEAYQLANSLNVTKFPFLGLLCLTRKTTMTLQGAVKSAPKISLVLKIQGSFNEDVNESELIDSKFIKKVAKYLEELDAIKMELRDKFLSQMLLEQQELNYKKSLAQDRAKKNAKIYEKLKKQYLVHRLPYFLQLGNLRDFAKIAIKMPNGSRTTVQFPPDEQVEIVFEYVELYLGGYLEKVILEVISEAEAREKFKNFKLKYDFKLLSPMPPRVVLNEKRGVKIREIDVIFPNGLLIVEEKEP